MQGKPIVVAVAALGWIVASLIAFALVTSFTFFGVGVIGLLLWFVCVRMELEKDAAIGTGWTPSLIQTQYEARQKMSDEQRAAAREEQTLALQSMRFFRHLGMALTLIGAVGFGLFQI
ncbi:MAG: hypothetical protein JSR47_22030 [Proteobacteria bacterium]|nr:hypothetical protein [Pseudomonadota bacterium]